MGCPRRTFLGELALPLTVALVGCATVDTRGTARSGAGEAKDDSKKEKEEEVEIIGQKGYLELGDAFEEREQQHLGKGGFENAVDEVATLGANLGLADLSRFTA